MAASTLSFTIISPEVAQFGPRLGSISLLRRDGSTIPEIHTPGLITSCSRGVVPHLSRGHVNSTTAIRWANIPFESFLERQPPIPTLQTGPQPLHNFLGFNPDQHLLSLSARDPSEGREVPPNGKDFISTQCIRGIRKLSPLAWKCHALACQPDIIIALSDNPLPQTSHSQKRLTKSLERSTAWLADLLRPINDPTPYPNVTHPFNVLVNMVGGAEERARTSFAEALMETLHGKDQEQVKPLRILDEGITGYVFELLPLLRAIRIFAKNKNPDSTSHTNSITDTTNNESTPSNPVETQDVTRLIKASLSPLPHTKLRVAYSSPSPHQILRLIRDIGVDLLDAHWAQKAADLGIALDFRFPFPEIQSSPGPASRPSTQPRGKRNLGHNLFLSSYATDHSRLASSFVAAAEVAKQPPTENDEIQVCPCSACSPLSPSSYLEHSTAEDHDFINAPPTIQPPYTRAYIHHLLHTHEMSSHSLLAMHNLSVVDAFFSGIRKMLGDPNGKDKFEEEVDRFCATYDEDMTILHEAEKDWNRVELERGKGRLAREKERQQAQDSTNSTVAAT